MKKNYVILLIISSFLRLNAQTNPYLQGNQCVTNISVTTQTASIFTSDGKIYTWGLNNFGQAGNGTTQTQNIPWLRPATPDFATISHGYISSAGLTKDGKIYTWGTNLTGVLGDGTTIDNFTPTQVGTDSDWVKVVNTWVNNIALKNDGTLWGWGNNGNCALSNTAAVPDNFYPQPIPLSADTDWVEIGAGAGKTFAIKSNGTLWARGRNNNYVLGLPDLGCIGLTQVGTDTDWKKVIPSNLQDFTLALKTDNTLWVWGTYNENFFTPTPTATQIGTDTWREVAAGSFYAVGIKSDGTLWQWGAGCWGNTSSIIPENSAVPVQVGTSSDWVKVAAGLCISFAVRADNTVWAFGANYMDFFNGTPLSPATPVLMFQCANASTSQDEISNIVLYPNPTVDKIFWAQNIAIEKVTVFDMNGKQILSQNVSGFSLDVSHLSNGTYLIKLETNDKSFYNSKFIKK